MYQIYDLNPLVSPFEGLELESVLLNYNRQALSVDPVSIAPPQSEITIEFNGRNETLQGTERRDVITDTGFRNIIFANGGNDEVISNASTLQVYGGEGHDRISRGIEIFGGAGNDWLIPNVGGRAYGGDGDDTIFIEAAPRSDPADALADGGAGNDLIYLRGGPSTVIGGEGDDTFDLTFFGDRGGLTIMDGGAGLDTFIIANGTRRKSVKDDLVASITEQGDGSFILDWARGDTDILIDVEFVQFRDFTIDLREGSPTITALTDSRVDVDNYSGTEGVDIIQGFNGDDVIYGLGGSDYIEGGRGNDTLYGGDGNDTINTTRGASFSEDATDTVFAGSGDDIILTNRYGTDIVSGGAGDDTIVALTRLDTPTSDSYDGGEGFDTVEFQRVSIFEMESFSQDASTGVISLSLGRKGVTLLENIEQIAFDDFTIDMTNGLPKFGAAIDAFGRVSGSNDSELIFSGSSAGQRILGRDGNDFINGGGGNDSITGGDGNDYLLGGTGNNALRGGEGDDYLDVGESGNAFGGNGDDTIYISTNFIVKAFGGDGDDLFIIDEFGQTLTKRIVGGDGYDVLEFDGDRYFDSVYSFEVRENGNLVIFERADVRAIVSSVEVLKFDNATIFVQDILDKLAEDELGLESPALEIAYNDLEESPTLTDFEDLSLQSNSVWANAGNISRTATEAFDIDALEDILIDLEVPEFDIWL